MAATEKMVMIKLERVTWKSVTWLSGGGGVQLQPEFSPYLWTIFFKLDGSTIEFAETGFLTGVATVDDAQGKHGDLGIWEIHPGESVEVPDWLGLWSANLKPFPVHPSIQALLDSAGKEAEAAYGCIAILLHDGGHIPADAVDAGRKALTDGLRQFLNQQLNMTLGLFQSEIPDEAIDAAQVEIQGAIEQAMKDAMGTLEQLWALSGRDRFIAAWMIMGDAANPPPTDTFLFPKDGGFAEVGIWELKASVTLIDTCPAEAVAGLFGASSREGEPLAGPPWARSAAAEALGAMREFRDSGSWRKRPGLHHWWRIARQHAPEAIRLLRKDPKLRHLAADLLKATPGILGNPGRPLGKRELSAIGTLLAGFEKQGSLRLKSVSARARRRFADAGKLPLHELFDRLDRESAELHKGRPGPNKTAG